MYRSRGKIKEFIDIRDSILHTNSTAPLSRKELKLLEKTNILTPFEKKDLLLISLGYKLSSEIEISSTMSKKEIRNKDEVASLLKKLPFPFYFDTLRTRRRGKMITIQWFQVSLNEKVNYLMKKYAARLSVIEQGVIYGYSIEGIRAFAGLIDIHNEEKDKGLEPFMGRQFSKEFYRRELKDIKSVVGELRKLSSLIVEQVEESFRELF